MWHICKDLLHSRYVFSFKMLHRRCIWLYGNEHSQSNTQNIIFMNHGHTFRLPQRSPHQTVANHRKGSYILKRYGRILCSIPLGTI